MSNEYEEFLESLMESKEKRPIMTHLPSDVRYVSKFFDGYLTEEELQERQFTGRYWCIRGGDDITYAMLLIVLDNDTVLYVTRNSKGMYTEAVCNRNDALCFLPNSLRGMYYGN